jgi:hypothetical protein
LSEADEFIQHYYEPKIRYTQEKIHHQSEAYEKGWKKLGIGLCLGVLAWLFISFFQDYFERGISILLGSAAGLASFVIFFMALLELISVRSELSSLRKEIIDTEKEQELYLSYPPHVVPSVKEAFDNKLLMSESNERLTNKTLGNLAKIYIELELLPITELKGRLVKQGILAEDETQRNFPNSDNEALLLKRTQ